jgi:hypothetical protein
MGWWLHCLHAVKHDWWWKQSQTAAETTQLQNDMTYQPQIWSMVIVNTVKAHLWFPLSEAQRWPAIMCNHTTAALLPTPKARQLHTQHYRQKVVRPGCKPALLLPAQCATPLRRTALKAAATYAQHIKSIHLLYHPVPRQLRSFHSVRNL